MRRSEEYSHSFVITFVCCLKSGFINFYMNLKAIRISYQTIIPMKRLVGENSFLEYEIFKKRLVDVVEDDLQ